MKQGTRGAVELPTPGFAYRRFDRASKACRLRQPQRGARSCSTLSPAVLRISDSLKRYVSFIWIFSSREKSHLLRGPGCLGPNEGIVTTKSTEAITIVLRPPEPSAEKTRAGADWINRQSQRPFRLKGGIQEEFLAVVATCGHIR